MKNLIVNADDLGWTSGVNRGIADAHQRGLVTSTSLLANGSAFDDGVARARLLPDLAIGVHLNLSDGAPVSPLGKVPSLVNPAGVFEGGPESLLMRMATQSLKTEEVELEWDAQIAKIRDAGVQPSHLDGHKHVQMLPGLFSVALKLAKRHGIGAIRVSLENSRLRTYLSSGEDAGGGTVLKQGVQARGLKLLAHDARELAARAGISTADFFCGIAQTGVWTRAGVAKLLETLPEGTTELMCHPGYVDEDLAKSPTRLQESRRTELDILTDPEIRNIVASQGIRLIDYKLVTAEA